MNSQFYFTGVFINQTDYAQVILTDVSLTNGVVHIIDRDLKVVTEVNSGTSILVHTSLIITCLRFILTILKM